MSLKRPAKPVSWLTANTEAEANLATKLLPRLSKLSLQGVHINFCEPSGLLIVNEDVELAISIQKLKTSDVGTKHEARVQPRISVTKRDARVHELRVSAPKRVVRLQSQVMPKCELCVSVQECETHVQPKATPEHDLHVSILKCESRVQQLTVSKHDLRVSLQKPETRVQQEAAPECDHRILLQKCEVRAQPQDVKFKCELVSPHLMGLRLDLPVLVQHI